MFGFGRALCVAAGRPYPEVMTERRIPEATVARLPVYRRSLIELAQAHLPTVSSEQLATMAGVNAAKVRKDLSYLGTYGTRGVGYEVRQLLYEIDLRLGLSQDSPVVIVGMGNLGQALANYGGFRERGFPVAALVDVDATKVGSTVAGRPVQAFEAIHQIVAAEKISVGIIATPAAAAQEVADALVAAGVRSILNFAPTVLNVPPSIPLRKVDLATELQILSFYQEHPAGNQTLAG